MCPGEPYASVVIAGKSTPELWFFEKWMPIVRALEPLVTGWEKDIAIRTTQTDGNKQQLRFGRLGWNDKSHRKWTHASPATGAHSPAWTMINGEVWAPSWTACARDHG